MEEIYITDVRCEGDANISTCISMLLTILCLAVSLNTEEIYITDVRCGGDATIFISNEGHLYACGSNKVETEINHRKR